MLVMPVRRRHELADAGGEARMTIAINDQVTRRHDRKLTGAAKAEPRPTAFGPRATMTVSHRLDRLVADRHAHKRRRAMPRPRLIAAHDVGQLLREKRVVELGHQAHI